MRIAGLGLLLAMIGSASAGELLITVSRAPAGDWRVDYQVEAAIDRLVFLRNTTHFRHQRWTPAQGRLTLTGDFETLTSETPRRRFTLHLPELSETLVKDYELVRSFTDGSAALYTGHLAAVPLASGAPPTRALLDAAEQGSVIRYRFTPRANERVIIDGQGYDQAIDWTDSSGRGSYVYFGAIEPLMTSQVLAIIDPGLPFWAVERMNGLIPRLFAHYEQHIGMALGQRPTVLFSFMPSDAGGLHNGGGVLPDLVQLYLKGDDWLKRDEAAEFKLEQLLAHEAAHLWNNHRVINAAGEHAAWLHEGGADAMAHRALYDLGRIDAQRYARLIDTQLNACLDGLNGRTLEGVEFALHYACGAVLYRLIEIAVGDLFGFLGRVFEGTEAEAGEYQLDDLLETLRAITGNQALSDSIEAIARTGAPDSLAAFERAARSAGAAVSIPTSIDDPAYGARMGARAMAHLMGQDCDGRFSFNTEAAGFRIAPPPGCRRFLQPMVITHIDQHHAIENGVAAHDRTVEACTGGDPLLLARQRGEPLALSCTLPLAPRTPYRQLSVNSPTR